MTTGHILDSGREHRTAGLFQKPRVVPFPSRDSAGCIIVTIELPSPDNFSSIHTYMYATYARVPAQVNLRAPQCDSWSSAGYLLALWREEPRQFHWGWDFGEGQHVVAQDSKCAIWCRLREAGSHFPFFSCTQSCTQSVLLAKNLRLPSGALLKKTQLAET